MPWVKLHSGRALNHVLTTAGFEARGLDAEAIQLIVTEGTAPHLSHEQLDRLAQEWGYITVDHLADRLVASSAWERVEDGYLIPEKFAWTRRPNYSRRLVGLFASRPSIPKAVRQLVYERDGFACQHCGSPHRLSLDHIIPFSFGGSDHETNLRTLCKSCNSSRGAGRW